ncbi:hypothetical protein BASA50_002228 [Batrachochytrium salamandrivorans]|uniref:Uncharacterized protein n=1 Tax=Batrachochytrium salamandrivorans TaxID=1357716 RepID=A0ABQ8FMF7_9FUNG|nr:hypothetical protein BASA62_001716 [Batrachochytrium salamandrivorans]KAH6600528.1 hypothetical protein BASA50_002228 [Batrachochytrium salamandrivorans]KAH9269469.1 hypothetical protein BASA83_008418 [Batrachochytrium salamandrivorans]
MIYTSYARIAIIVALVSASVATPVAQDQTSVHLEKRTPQGGIEDDEVSLPGSSSGGSHDTHDTLPKGEASESQFTSNCRGRRCKLPKMTERQFFLRDRDMKFININGELTKDFSKGAKTIPYTYKGYLDAIKEIEASNDKQRKSGKKQAKPSTKRLLSDRQSLQKWKADTTRLVNELKKRLLVSKEDLEKAFEGSGSEGSSTGRSQMPRAQATQLYIGKTGRVSPIKEEGSRKNPISDKAYLKLLSKLSGYERAKWGLKPKKMLSRII